MVIDVWWKPWEPRAFDEPSGTTHKARCGLLDDHGDHSCPGAFGFFVPVPVSKAELARKADRDANWTEMEAKGDWDALRQWMQEHPEVYPNFFDGWRREHVGDLQLAGRAPSSMVDTPWFVQERRFRLTAGKPGQPKHWTVRGHVQRRAMVVPALLPGERVWVDYGQVVTYNDQHPQGDLMKGPALPRDKHRRVGSRYRALPVSRSMEPMYLECPSCHRMNAMEGRKLPAAEA
jgi:hypothetical protein